MYQSKTFQTSMLPENTTGNRLQHPGELTADSSGEHSLRRDTG